MKASYGTKAEAMAMMSMQELFYGQQSEPAYFGHFGRQAGASSVSDYYSQAISVRAAPVSSFDLMVPMCCAQCEDQVRDALFGMRGVRDVVCDARNQRVAVTGSGVDPAQAVKQVRRVQSGAAFWSENRRYVASSYQKPQRSESGASSSRSRSRSSSSSSSADGSFARSFCPAYRDSAKTYYIRLNPSTATVEESEF